MPRGTSVPRKTRRVGAAVLRPPVARRHRSAHHGAVPMLFAAGLQRRVGGLRKRNAARSLSSSGASGSVPSQWRPRAALVGSEAELSNSVRRERSLLVSCAPLLFLIEGRGARSTPTNVPLYPSGSPTPGARHGRPSWRSAAPHPSPRPAA